jgi:hypothetical protein
MNVKIIILIYLLFCSCQKRQENELIDLTVLKEIKIKTENTILPNPAFIHLVESDSGRYLFLSNHISKRLRLTALYGHNGNKVNRSVIEYQAENRCRF